MASFPCIAILGHTASGKSTFSFSLSQQLPILMVNLDSVQIYEEVNIGSAKPPVSDFPFPTWGFNITTLNHPFDTSQYYDYIRTQIQDEKEWSEHLPILVGGTGLYFKALLFGLSQNIPKNESLRKRFQSLSEAELFAFLQEHDPKSAQHLHPHDRFRIIRAIEVFLSTGQSIQDIHQMSPQIPLIQPLQIIGLYLERDTWRVKMKIRVTEMIQRGLVEETEDLLRKYPQSRPLLSRWIGYKEVLHYLDGTMDFASMQENILLHTYQYAKRQMTLFRKIPNIQWVNADSESDLAKANDNILLSWDKEKKFRKTLPLTDKV